MSADYPSMTTAEIRSKFLNFFEERGLKLYPSSSLVPDDPSLLLANAGMNQFKEYYQGKKTMKEIGAISCQKCVRTNDIDCIGEDGRHLSFFEMLGDFSFGGVSKQQACAWAFELITKEFKLPLDRLYFTVFTEDDETHDVWRSLGVAEDHISRLGEDDNFWAAGPTGPCGPCSEIYFDMGEEVGCGSPDCKPGCDCDRFLEFWNLVFTQYDRQEDGSMPELPHRNLDTGMGLERMAAIMQHKTANYDGDLMQHLIKLGEEISGKTYDADDYSGASRSLRIIADHSRAVDFMISDGILARQRGPRVRPSPPAPSCRVPRPPAGHRGRLPDQVHRRGQRSDGRGLPRAAQERRARQGHRRLRGGALLHDARQRPRSTWTRPWPRSPTAPCFRATLPLSCTTPLVSPST